jgi:hypothetical protein
MLLQLAFATGVAFFWIFQLVMLLTGVRALSTGKVRIFRKASGMSARVAGVFLILPLPLNCALCALVETAVATPGWARDAVLPLQPTLTGVPVAFALLSLFIAVAIVGWSARLHSGVGDHPPAGRDGRGDAAALR